ncbi:protein LURP-one-related 15-like [Oryza brachyantha]|uniref:Protein LURP-one-related 15 n=1 Tax=Oryza brachyantha TaxID=4533 RepID=J3LU46_ORYBR|nr:protein LURP-one-related 15-like [Oryza brachyantha]
MEMEAVPALAVVDARFCAGDEAALSVAKTLSMSGNDFTVTDAATGAVVLRVDGVLFSLRRRCLLVDADRRPVLTVQESAMVMNTRWKVFRGESTSRRDLLFTVVKPSAIQLWGSTKVSVFLASNDAEQACDFRVTGSYHDGACAVSLGDSDTVIAKIDRRFSVAGALLGKNAYSVAVNAGIDYAFIVALVVILDEMHFQP